MCQLAETGHKADRKQDNGASGEFKSLNQQFNTVRFDGRQILRVRIIHQGWPKWCAVFPEALRKEVIWDVHKMVHACIGKTLERLRLDWYWPSMTSDVRQVVEHCEVCQVAK